MSAIQTPSFSTMHSTSETETVSASTNSEEQLPARTASFIVNVSLSSEYVDVASSLASSGVLPAYRFEDEIEEEFFSPLLVQNSKSLDSSSPAENVIRASGSCATIDTPLLSNISMESYELESFNKSGKTEDIRSRELEEWLSLDR